MKLTQTLCLSRPFVGANDSKVPIPGVAKLVCDYFGSLAGRVLLGEELMKLVVVHLRRQISHKDGELWAEKERKEHHHLNQQLR